MLNTNAEFLRPEIMDILRLFNAQDEDFEHYFSYGDGEFFNCINYGGNFYDFAEKFNPEGGEEYKRYSKRYAKLAFYKVLSEAKNISLPWGALTGVRPTKMAYMERAAGRNFADLFKTLGVNEGNISLVERVLEVQKPIYESNFNSGADLFISIPFCPTKCEYCSFITAPVGTTGKFIPDYIKSLTAEIRSLAPILNKVNSVYIGGGTPFTLSEEDLKAVFEAVKSLDIPQGVEYTVEAGRPDTFSREKLRLCKEYGVTRVCVNPQSFSDETLKAIGRKHTAADVYAAYGMTREYGFDVNLDLIAGLYGESLSDFADSVERATELNPENVTVHTLCLKSGAKLKENTQSLQVEGIGEMCALSREKLYDAGYEPYYTYRQKYQAGGNENAGWSKPGKACAYNVDVMEEICSNIAVGAAAISKRVRGGERIERFPTPKDIKTYIQKCPALIQGRLEFFK